MSSERYSTAQTFHEENRRSTDGYDVPFNRRVNVPIQRSTNNFTNDINEQQLQERIRHQDTTLQWVNDPISGHEKFRVNINIDGFNQNEVNIRVDGNKLLVYGEHIENKNQSTAKKIIEKSYELPRDIDVSRPLVTFPTSITMQVDFPSRHSNVIIDDGRTSNKLISNYDTTSRLPTRFANERSSTEYTSTRKLGSGGISGGSSFERSSIPPTYSHYDDLYGGNNVGRNNAYSSTNQYQSIGNRSPLRRDYANSTTRSFDNSTNPTYTYRVTAGDSQPRTTYPTLTRDESGIVKEKTFSETHRETEHRRSSPTSGVQSSREVEHRREGSPSLGRSLDGDRFQSNFTLGRRSVTPPSSSRNVEVREYSRRIGSTGNNNNFINNEPSLFTEGFNSDAFYRSAFQPQVFTDDLGQKRIEMKLDVTNYEPNEIKVTVNGNDLIVKAEHNVDRPPTSSSRAYFFKQITLPPNTDLTTLSSQYHPDGRLHITAKISHETASIRYN